MLIRWSLRLYSFHVRLVSTQRRAQNLSERYLALENTTRTKSEHVQSDEHVRALPILPLDTIAGFVIPKAPRVPADDECCMSGCAVCVYDLYEDALAAYREDVATLRAALAAQNIPETEWPDHIRTGQGGDAGAANSVLDAFEAMERALQAKLEKHAMVEAERTSVNVRAVYEAIRWICC